MLTMPSSLFKDITKPSHFKVAVALYALADRDGTINVSTKQLSDFCEVSESSLTRAFRELEDKGYLDTVRTRKGFNRFSFNVYRLLRIEPAAGAESRTGKSIRALSVEWGITENSQNEGLRPPSNVSDGENTTAVSLSLTDERSTAVKVADKALDSQVGHKEEEILRIPSPTGSTPKEFKSASENSLRQPQAEKPLSMDPKDFRTRGRRPIGSWTTWDVAAEFADRLQKAFPTRPTLINKKRLAKALLPMRSKYGSNAKAEMFLVDLFFLTRANIIAVSKEPHLAIGIFLNYFKTDLDRALNVSQHQIVVGKLIASDGTEFDNTIPGRAAFKHYEEKLKSSEESLFLSVSN